jgi:TonB family protein
MMNGFSAVEGLERWQARIIRRMMILSVIAHGAVILFGSSLSALFPAREFSPPVFVELTDEPVSELPEEEPAPPAPAASSARPESFRASADRPAPTRPAPKEPPAARRWLDKLDAGMANMPEAPVTRREGKAGGIPVRHWTNEGPARPGDFAPAVGPEKSAALGKHLGELEDRVRGSGRPGVGFGKETEASMMFGGSGDTAGEPIPAWIREMIRKRVRDRLPELEGIYADAIRRNPDLRGKLSVRFRIDPSGKVQSAEPADGSFTDAAFVSAVLDKVRRWTFEPTAGRTVEVLYPFVFVVPS